ncbi:MAG: DUF4231 domain-containing protein [Candidatus Thiodiazotropha sp.]
MDEKEYLKQRLDNQINWYDNKSVWYQKWFKRLQVIAIVGAATIPFLSGYMSEECIWVKIAIGVLGLVVAAITAILSLYQFQENWIEYRTTCESLKHEKYTYLTKAPPYDGENAFALLVERVETLISKENTNWTRQTKSYKKNKSEGEK